jgi:hypothetical protein
MDLEGNEADVLVIQIYKWNEMKYICLKKKYMEIL